MEVFELMSTVLTLTNNTKQYSDEVNTLRITIQSLQTSLKDLELIQLPKANLDILKVQLI